MAQIVRPVSDVSVGEWSPTPLYEKLDEEFSDGATTEITSTTLTSSNLSDYFQVRFPLLQNPKPGTHKLSVDVKGTGTLDDIYYEIQLVDDTKVIASMSCKQPSGSYQRNVLTLTEAEINEITDYGKLRLTFGGLTPDDCEHCSDDTPPKMQMTISGLGHEDDKCEDCASLNGTYELDQGASTPCNWGLGLELEEQICKTIAFQGFSVSIGLVEGEYDLGAIFPVDGYDNNNMPTVGAENGRAKNFGTTKPDCAAWDDLNLPDLVDHISWTGDIPACVTDNLVITVKAVGSSEGCPDS